MNCYIYASGLGINKRAISKLIECAPSTLYQWLKRRRIRSNQYEQKK